jgi:hypothetical protein
LGDILLCLFADGVIRVFQGDLYELLRIFTNQPRDLGSLSA